ncbi:MAG: Na+/H+ antiporter NhaA [Myxococcales bacterium]|nr:Na+/H+ antiporter NhaA [Myxococcales bacterium]MCB9669592.1 Na+/H+ antiporter NhaA [Alphaproteobacteria bacterium]
MEFVRRTTNLLVEFSIPLLLGVLIAMLGANVAPELYHHAVEWEPFGHVSLLGHHVTLHFLVNDLFMVLFFGVAAKEITESCLPGGSLNPIRKALNPLFATLGGVLGPIAVFLVGLQVLQATGVYGPDSGAGRGWGIPTATDIALAWMVARAVFGKGHPAIDFLLLLAIADDAIGLGIIAVFYGDPAHPAELAPLAFVAAGVGLAGAMRFFKVNTWLPYVFIAGPIAWYGLMEAHLHPALALVPIVPLIPGPKTDTGLFVEEDEVDLSHHGHHSPLHLFEHQVKPVVDFGLFFFAFANAGVALGGIGPMTGLVFVALLVGKTVGITAFALTADKLGFGLPQGMTRRDLVMAGYIAGLGLTVALFVSSAAFTDPALQGEAKMGALFSGLIGVSAVVLGRVLGFGGRPSAVDVVREHITEPIAIEHVTSPIPLGK